MTVTRQDLFEFARREFGTMPEYPWARTPNFGVLRHGHNKKWYAVVMDLPRATLGLDGDGIIDAVNVKCNPVLIGILRNAPGYRRAYHMNKEHWITIVLDGSAPADEIFNLVRESFNMTK